MLSKLNSPPLRRNHIAILIDEQIFIHGGVSENNETSLLTSFLFKLIMSS